ncbi:glycosyltransferase [uncultured Clostridium sp.]|uniref:glycosyltransferase n=1 Tax=uncultured Clostridium sp. TaxID=59620 RepID=UPI0025F29B46|nr:glycosyltransferase [uncultured Clostridium sp.]
MEDYTVIMCFLLGISYFIAKSNLNYRKCIIFLNTVVSSVYILWRAAVIPIHSGIFSFVMGVMLYSAELLGLIAFYNFQYLFYKKYRLEVKTLDVYKNEEIPFVDVLICTYNEPLYLLEKTIAACTNLHYPQNRLKIHICDDGRREKLKELSDKYGISYITRNDNAGAKAGNINNALKFLKGDLFVVLDADMIPKKSFLAKTVGYFYNENLAFIQTPQVYYNKDMYQYNLSKNIPNEQDFFMRDIQEARAANNAVLHVGTNAVFRRKYINEIGGYPTYSITEDMAVGMMLQSKGYDSLFINEELVLGLSAVTFEELVKQRDRWCRGNLQVLKHFNPIFMKGLSFSQKIAYFDGAVYWFSNLQKIIYMICPIIFLITGRLIIDASIESLLSFYIPFVLGNILIFEVLSPKTRSIRWSHYYNIAMAPHLSVSILKEFIGLKINFNITSKEVVQNKKYFQYKIVMPHILLMIVTIISWVISTRSLLNNNMIAGAYIINMAWSLYNFIGVGISLYVAYQKPIFRTSERILITENIATELNTNFCSICGSLIDISEFGVGVKLHNTNENILKPNDNIVLNLKETKFECEVIRTDNNFAALKFKKLYPSQMKIIMSIFTDNMSPYYKVNRS